MPQPQLELAWLGCIFADPDFCRENGGLSGLQASMFQKSSLFECGALWLRKWECKTDIDLLHTFPELFSELGILSQLARLDFSIGFLPSFFKHYAREIERRSDRRFDCPWLMN